MMSLRDEPTQNSMMIQSSPSLLTDPKYLTMLGASHCLSVSISRLTSPASCSTGMILTAASSAVVVLRALNTLPKELHKHTDSADSQ